jgi:hypothetical protein
MVELHRTVFALYMDSSAQGHNVPTFFPNKSRGHQPKPRPRTETENLPDTSQNFLEYHTILNFREGVSLPPPPPPSHTHWLNYLNIEMIEYIIIEMIEYLL